VASNTVNVTSVIFAATPKQCEVKKTYIQIVVQRLLREVLEGSSNQGALPSPPAFTFINNFAAFMVQRCSVTTAGQGYSEVD